VPQTVQVTVGPQPDHSFWQNPPPTLVPNPVHVALQPVPKPVRHGRGHSQNAHNRHDSTGAERGFQPLPTAAIDAGASAADAALGSAVKAAARESSPLAQERRIRIPPAVTEEIESGHEYDRIDRKLPWFFTTSSVLPFLGVQPGDSFTWLMMKKHAGSAPSMSMPRQPRTPLLYRIA
jgi:hypothetical protein